MHYDCFKITSLGQTKIYAWTIDEGGSSSEEAEEIVLFDNIIPTITSARITAEEGENGWITSTGEISITAEDNIQGELSGYIYEVYDINNILRKKSNGILKIDTPISVETDGIWKIKINAIDKAGNESLDKIVEVKKDTVEPEFNPEKITVSKTGITSIKVAVRAIDDTSGNPINEGSITYSYFVTELGTSMKIAKGSNTTRRSRNNRISTKQNLLHRYNSKGPSWKRGNNK